jgi:hypothetical protein
MTTGSPKHKRAPTPIIRERQTQRCATPTLGGLCVACETEPGITFLYFGRYAAVQTELREASLTVALRMVSFSGRDQRARADWSKGSPVRTRRRRSFSDNGTPPRVLRREFWGSERRVRPRLPRLQPHGRRPLCQSRGPRGLPYAALGVVTSRSPLICAHRLASVRFETSSFR